jgi:methionine-R-sulfoxide reductase
MLKQIIFLATFITCFFVSSCSQAQNNKKNMKESEKNIEMTSKIVQNKEVSGDTIKKTEQEWKQILTPEQFAIIRQKGTERPFTGKFLVHNDKGVYTCAACGNELFTSEQKFDSHCGWPSFYDEIKGGKIKTVVDKTHGMVRTEIMCAKCDGHLGHVFDDGPNPTGLRYCVNSVSLGFKKE